MSGNRHHGTFMHEKNGIFLDIFDFEHPPRINENEPIFLLSERMSNISLYHSVCLYRSDNSSGSTGDRFYIQKFQSNFAIIGDDRWRPEHKVRRINFKLPVDRLFWNPTRFRSIEAANFRQSDFEIFTVSTSKMNISCYFTAKQMSWSEGFTDFSCEFQIELTKGVPFGEHHEFVAAVKWFFVGCLGKSFNAFALRINRLTIEQFIEEIENKGFAPEHVELSGPNDEEIQNAVDDGVGIIWASPVKGDSNEEIENMKQNLAAWVERLDDWKEAYAHMEKCFMLRGELSSERLLSACKWLESIKTANHQKIIDEVAYNDWLQEILEKSKYYKLDVDENRIIGAVRVIQNESHRVRFERLVESIISTDTRFQRVEVDRFVRDLSNSQSLRGKAAHSDIDLKKSDDIDEVARAIFAVEALCIQLTMLELPWSDTARERLIGHKAFQAYLNLS
ncbi:hypothetical protein [Rhodobacteraceae bacterium W635]|uniref:hypothetical protein n=1 Tax=Nioella halotolerans TaxID=2303578 RepID=UPI0011C1300D